MKNNSPLRPQFVYKMNYRKKSSHQLPPLEEVMGEEQSKTQTISGGWTCSIQRFCAAGLFSQLHFLAEDH